MEPIIPGPKPSAGPEYVFEADYDMPANPALKFTRFIGDLIRKPAQWLRENVVEPNRGPKYYWYHRKFERAVPIDECYMDDLACFYEANVEFERNKLVDCAVLDILRNRRDNCWQWHRTTAGNMGIYHESCKPLEEAYDREEINFFTKYGDMRWDFNVAHAYNKQKHRMIFERRVALAKEKQQQEQQTQN